MSDTLLNLLLQIPLAGVVVVVVILFLNHLDRSNARQDVAQERMIKFLTEQEEKNREFLKEQRAANVESIGRLADKIDAISSEVSRMNGVLVAHDARSQERDRRFPDVGK
jgi:regulator of sirC expression with transglutaminase-like and TPR domain